MDYSTSDFDRLVTIHCYNAGKRLGEWMRGKRIGLEKWHTIAADCGIDIVRWSEIESVVASPTGQEVEGLCKGGGLNVLELWCRDELETRQPAAAGLGRWSRAVRYVLRHCGVPLREISKRSGVSSASLRLATRQSMPLSLRDAVRCALALGCDLEGFLSICLRPTGQSG